MKREIILIRHAETRENFHGKYLGRTDSPLCEEGAELLRFRAGVYPRCGLLFASPMKRCLQTAEILYPNLAPTLIDDFRECDFGDFEDKNYAELSGNADYQAWIDSNGTLPFPNGEAPDEFRTRCVRAFRECMDSTDSSSPATAFVVHGGTVMSVLEALASERKGYFDWQIQNGNGYVCVWNGETLEVRNRLW